MPSPTPSDRPDPTESAAPPARVARRRVHYFSGFDPRGAAYYHRLLREELDKPQPSGRAMQAGARRRQPDGVHAWPVRCHREGEAGEIVTEHVFMSWDDIIRQHWSRHPLALAREFFEAYAAIVLDVRLGRVRQISRPSFITGVAPAAYLLLTLLLGVALAAGGAAGLGAAGLSGWAATLPAALLGLAAVAGAWTWGGRRGLFWLMRIFTFVVRLGRGPVAGLDGRAQAWVEHIITRQRQEPADEVVLVGHSVGTLVMVDVVDRLLADPRWQALQAGRRTAMLTLGQCYPFVALVPSAGGFRAALHRLSTHPGLAWLDVTALIDPLCFHRAHPLARTGVDADALPNPARLSARFFPMYRPETWAAIRRDKLRAHFLYMMTPDRPGNFDLFDTLYGPHPFEHHVRPGAAAC